MAEPNTPSFITLSSGQQQDLKSYLSRGDGFYLLMANDFPPCIPASLQAKWDSAMAIVSGSTSESGALLIVGHRIDAKDNAMDLHPFVVAVSSSQPGASAIFLDHLSSTSRSITLPPGFVSALTASGISNYYYNNPPFGAVSGTLSQLPEPMREALSIVLSFLPPPSSGSGAA